MELEGLLTRNAEGPYIFSSSRGIKPIHHTTISTVIGEIARGSCGSEEPYKPGDVRRTVETRLQALGVSKDVRAQLLSHGRTSDVQARHYERHDYLREKASALDCWEAHLLAIVSAPALTGPPCMHNAHTSNMISI